MNENESVTTFFDYPHTPSFGKEKDGVTWIGGGRTKKATVTLGHHLRDGTYHKTGEGTVIWMGDGSTNGPITMMDSPPSDDTHVKEESGTVTVTSAKYEWDDKLGDWIRVDKD